jgi:hypothetical protein
MNVQAKKPLMTGRARRSVLALIMVMIVVIVVIVGLVLWIYRAAGSTEEFNDATPITQSSALTQTNEAGQVMITVTWQGRSGGPVFTVAMNTHAVNLDSYDLRQLAVLRTDQGLSIQPSEWNAPAGGHHRTGTLIFPATTTSGASVIGPKTRTMTLLIRNVSSIPERSFRWTL